MVPAKTASPPQPLAPDHPPRTETRSRDNPPLAVFMPLAGFLILLALSTILDPTRGRLPAAGSLAIFAAAVAGCACLATPGVAILLAICAWLDYDGFVVGREGTLSWHGGPDLVRMVVLAAVTVVVLTARHLLRRRERSR
jgi:K+-sensing histidine kinase KdpD